MCGRSARFGWLLDDRRREQRLALHAQGDRAEIGLAEFEGEGARLTADGRRRLVAPAWEPATR